MKTKISAEDATWQIREAAWGLEERVLWRGIDAARGAGRRAGRGAHRVLSGFRATLRWSAHQVSRALQPPLRLIQAKLLWPLADRLEDYGMAIRTGLATLTVAAAVGAAVAGALLAGSGEAPAQPATPPALAAQITGAASTLQGATPNFEADPNSTTVAVKARPPGGPAPGAPDAPPARVAWRFAEAFVQYEVGRVDEQAIAAFAASAKPPLAKALSDDPPRLPAGTEVPKARVLNIVLSEQEGKEIVASVSLLRMQAASELRLTLRETDKGWRVAEVLG